MSDTVTAGSVRSQLADARLYLCTDARKRQGDLPEFLDAAAGEEGVDYFCTGPCWPTPTKPGRHAPGLDLVRHTAALGTDRPWFAIGGIDLGNLDQVLEAGARRVVVVRAITEADDPAAAAAEFAKRLRQA